MARVANPLTNLRYRLEASCLGEIHFKILTKGKDRPSDPDKHRNFYRQLIPIQREMVPAADEALDIACERLGLGRATAHGFVDIDPKMGASCYGNIRRNVVEAITSGSIERLTVQKTTYVFGSEPGLYIQAHR